VARAVGVEDVRDGQQAGDRHARSSPTRSSSRRLHLHGERSLAYPRASAREIAIVEEVARDDRADPRPRAAPSAARDAAVPLAATARAATASRRARVACGAARVARRRDAQRLDEPAIGRHALARAERTARAVARERRVGDHELAEREATLRERPARADADRAREAEVAELLEHDRRAGPPMPVLWIVSGSPSAATPV